VTHRVAGSFPDGLKTKGDANQARDPWTVPQRNVVGQVVAGVPAAGYLLVFFQQPSGVPSLVLLAMSILLAWALFFPADPEATDGSRRPKHRRRRLALG
jgi:signal peptidase